MPQSPSRDGKARAQPPHPAEPESNARGKQLSRSPGQFGEGHLASALHSIDAALAWFNRDDGLEFCNRAYRRLLEGALAESLIGSSYEELLDAWIGGLQFASDDERDRFRSERLLRRGEPRVDFDVRTRAGRWLRVNERLAPDGSRLTTILDLTEHELELAQERLARLAAEAASAAKSQLSCSMSHEVRTPLNAILGFSQLMQRDLKQPLSSRHRARVGHILKGGEHLLQLADDLLDLSRIEAGTASVSLEPVDVLAVIERLHETLGVAASDCGVRLELTRPAAGSVPLISADPTRLAQILMNLGSNAIKYNRPNGSVCFSLSAPSPESVRVSVADTGVGIAAAQHARIFEPFQRAGQERGAIAGTGLGLAISKRLAELMRGVIGFQSIVGQGSEFWLDMPVHQPP